MDNLEKLRQLEQEAKNLRESATDDIRAEVSRIEGEIRALAEKVKGTGTSLDLYYLRDALEDLYLAMGDTDWNSSNC